jgi:serine phosphatase RsbU (regulator of sigma subunit)
MLSGSRSNPVAVTKKINHTFYSMVFCFLGKMILIYIFKNEELEYSVLQNIYPDPPPYPYQKEC